MLHDIWFYLFMAETLGLLTIMALVGRAITGLRATNKPLLKASTPAPPGSLRERMQNKG